MSAAKDLLRSPMVALNRLGGYIGTLENQVADYRARLLRDTQLQDTLRAFNGLRETRGEQVRKPLDMADLEAVENLKAAKTLVRDRLDEWAAEGEQMLAPTGVSFTRWRTVISALDKKQDPEISPTEAEELVKSGFLRRTYTLGGPAR